MKNRQPQEQEKAINSKARILASAFGLITLIIASVFLSNNYAFATDCETNILDCESGGAVGIWNTIRTIINILTVAAGILAAAGITFVGIQYLTAGGNEEKTRKAKRRMIEIVIGLALYVLLNTVVSWLLPNGTTPPSDTGSSGSSSYTQTQAQDNNSAVQNMPNGQNYNYNTTQ